MDTQRAEKQWQAVMKVAVDMKKMGLDTGDAVQHLRDAKVLLNHCIYDEHAHGDELFEAEKEIEEIQMLLQSILNKTGREKDFSFEPLPEMEKKSTKESAPPPTNLPKNKTWTRIRISEKMKLEDISNIQGVEIIEKDEDTITLAGDPDSIQKALKEISKGYLK